MKRFVTVLMSFILPSSMSTFIGCASQATAPDPLEMRTVPDPRARELDLASPEADEARAARDVTKLSDAALTAQIAESNREVNRLTAQTFEMALDETQVTSPAYRQKLRELKAAETQLGDLEMEQIRRRR